MRNFYYVLMNQKGKFLAAGNAEVSDQSKALSFARYGDARSYADGTWRVIETARSTNGFVRSP